MFATLFSGPEWTKWDKRGGQKGHAFWVWFKETKE